jgi:hypothetical protein
MRLARGSEQTIAGIDNETFLRNYPFVDIKEGNPTRFTVIRENEDGSLRVRFNKYPVEKTRAEISYVPVPRDLKDNAGSIPIVPRKHISVLEDAATFLVMLLKHDDRAQIYAELVSGKLLAMVNQNRGSLLRIGEDYGRIISRRDLLPLRRRRLFPDEPY